VGSEAYLVFVAAFRISAHDLVSLSSRSRYLHPDSAHGAVVGNCLGLLLLLYLLYVLEIAQDSLRTGRGPSDLIGVRICVLRYLLRPETELDLDSATFLLSDWGLARLSLLGSLPLSLRLGLRSSSIGLGPWWTTLGWRSGRWLGWRSGRWLGWRSGRWLGWRSGRWLGWRSGRWRRGGRGWRRGSAWRRRCGFLVCFVSHAISYRRCGCPLKESGGCWIYSCRVGE